MIDAPVLRKYLNNNEFHTIRFLSRAKNEPHLPKKISKIERRRIFTTYSSLEIPRRRSVLAFERREGQLLREVCHSAKRRRAKASLRPLQAEEIEDK